MYLTLCLVALLAVCESAKTYGDVKKCTAASLESCKPYCQKYHPTADFEKAKKCYEYAKNELSSCMNKQGVAINDTSLCYPYHDSRKKHSHSAQSTLPNNARCYKRCVKRAHRKCHEGCTTTPIHSKGDHKGIWSECKNDDLYIDCLESSEPAPIANVKSTVTAKPTVPTNPKPTVAAKSKVPAKPTVPTVPVASTIAVAEGPIQ